MNSREKILKTLGTKNDPGGFTWIAAGMEPLFHPEIGIKWAKRSKSLTPAVLEYKDLSKDLQAYKLNDRVMVLNAKGDSEVSYKGKKPLDPKDYDEVISLSPFTLNSPINRELDIVLSAAMYGLKKNRFENHAASSGLVHIADSGGYQLKVGVTEWVDPLEVIKWQNSASDFSFILDTPPKYLVDWGDPDVHKSMALVQSHLADLYLQNKSPELKVLNIVHGSTAEFARRWIDIVNRNEFVGWGAAVDNNYDVISAFRSAIILLKEYKTNWIHILGVSGILAMPAMAWLAKISKARITCDSSSHYEGMRHRKYFLQLPNGKLDTQFRAGNFKNSMNKSSWVPLPCSCPVCRLIGVTDVLLHENRRIGPLIVMHNLVCIKRYVNMLQASAAKLDFQQFKSLVGEIGGSNAIQLLDYVDFAWKNGVDAAEKGGRFRFCFGLDKRKLSPKPSLNFTDPKDVSHIPDGSNLEIVPLYIDLDKKANLTKFPESVRSWWKKKRKDKAYLKWIVDQQACKSGEWAEYSDDELLDSVTKQYEDPMIEKSEGSLVGTI